MTRFRAMSLIDRLSWSFIGFTWAYLGAHVIALMA